MSGARSRQRGRTKLTREPMLSGITKLVMAAAVVFGVVLNSLAQEQRSGPAPSDRSSLDFSVNGGRVYSDLIVIRPNRSLNWITREPTEPGPTRVEIKAGIQPSFTSRSARPVVHLYVDLTGGVGGPKRIQRIEMRVNGEAFNLGFVGGLAIESGRAYISYDCELLHEEFERLAKARTVTIKIGDEEYSLTAEQIATFQKLLK